MNTVPAGGPKYKGRQGIRTLCDIEIKGMLCA